MKKIIALIGGLAGASTVTLLHEALKYTVPSVAPRMDLLGMEAMTKIRQRVHLPVPSEDKLYKQTFIGDLIANTLYYSLAGGSAADLKGTALGVAAGIGAVQLPEQLHLTPAHSNRTKATEYLSMGIYIAGGLVTAATIELLTNLTHKKIKIPHKSIKIGRKKITI
jgi:hypothetical protein